MEKQKTKDGKINLTKFQKDALKEVGNIGAGKAAAALGKMTDSTVIIDMVKMRIIPIKEISSLVGGPTIPATGCFFDLTGDLPGYFLMLSSKKTALSLVDLLNKKKVGTTKALGDMEKDTLKELGNILVGTYLASLSDLASINILESTPKLIINNADEIFKEVIEQSGGVYEDVLVIDTKIDIKKEKFVEELIMVLKPESFEYLFNVLIKKLRKKECKKDECEN